MNSITMAIGLALALAAHGAQAASQEIRALFQPDPSQPSKNVFINKTPVSGYCASHVSECADNNMFSLQLPIRFNAQRPLVPMDYIQIRVPASWRQLTVTNSETGETETVEVRITGIGSNYVLSDAATEITGEADNIDAHRKLWVESSWVNAPPPCQYSGMGFLTPKTYQFFWKTPQEGACTKTTAYAISHMSMDYLDFAYELRTPNPLRMSSGLYTGSMAYSIGPASDFDLGSFIQPDDSVLNLDFVLDVQHTLKVDLPPGGNKVLLEPEGGWMRWIDSGRQPTRIFRDQLFHISASSRFKVMILCDSTGGTRCKLGSPRGNVTEVETFLTLPAGINGPAGGAVNLLQLRYNTWAGPFQPGFYVDRKAGSLRFEMPRDAIDFLMRPGFTDTLSGSITVIWDSDV